MLFGEKTQLNRIMPKAKFMKLAELSTPVRVEFQNNVDRLILTNILRQETTNISKGKNVQEIDVFEFLLTPDAWMPALWAKALEPTNGAFELTAILAISPIAFALYTSFSSLSPITSCSFLSCNIGIAEQRFVFPQRSPYPLIVLHSIIVLF